MYFYRIMKPEEILSKKIQNNVGDFEEAINTHKYLDGINYIHLFLNAESCFEDFTLQNRDELIVVKFDIPDDIVFKYGIGLGGYHLYYNKYTQKYREFVTRNRAGTENFWLPEIAIPEDDFDYDWGLSFYQPKKEMYQYKLPENFITDDLAYKRTVDDGYLKGFKNEYELLEKYKNMLKHKKQIIDCLKEFKKINIHPENFNCDSFAAYLVLNDYAIKNNIINSSDNIVITIKKELQPNSINITSNYKSNEKEKYIIIDKELNHTVPGFTAALDNLGFEVEKHIFQCIKMLEQEIKGHSLTKKM